MSGLRNSSVARSAILSSFPSSSKRRRRLLAASAGMTLLELLIACSILLVLATVAMPLARVSITRRKETELRYDLRQMRDAIDRYKDASDKNLIKVAAGTEGYPPDLDTLVAGVKLVTAGTQEKDRRVRFLRAIPVDPFTGAKDWGLRSVQDDADSTSWGGQDIFDVYSKSNGTALDGSKYSEW
jgi:general secretion pathway protein G